MFGMSLTALIAGVALVSADIRLELPPGTDNPRNSEGAFVGLDDGRILYAYSHYTGRCGDDHGTAHIASRVSSDGGLTWSGEDKAEVAFDGVGQNIMSVSFLRLAPGKIAMFYLRKRSAEDCRPVMRVSTDEAASWGPERYCVADSEKSYYVMNNDRAIRLKTGRIVLPLCRMAPLDPGKGWDLFGETLCALSDDEGRSWRLGKAVRCRNPQGARIWGQEPGVLELKDGRLMVWVRTNAGCQYRAFSSDGGETLGEFRPWNLVSPCSPASVKRLSDGRLVALWNDHARHPEFRKGGAGIAAEYRAAGQWSNGQRTPLTIAFSSDEGESWQGVRDIGTDPSGWYCYIALLENRGRLLLGYCARSNLAHSRIATVDNILK